MARAADFAIGGAGDRGQGQSGNGAIRIEPGSEVKLLSFPAYERARVALARAASLDEVKPIRDLAVAATAYARQAKDPDLIDRATEIRLRAERRAGELLSLMRERGERARGGGDAGENKESRLVTLSALGVTRMQSHRWQGTAALSAEAFGERLAAARREAAASIANPRASKLAEKRARREAREAELGAAQRALPDRRYGVILADPEWAFENWSEAGMGRAAANHYPVSKLVEIFARDVGKLAARDCALFLWATAPMLPEALMAMTAWGFVYRSHVVWRKDATGTGYWFRNAHELLLLGVRGAPPAPAPGLQYPSVLAAPGMEHSRKPLIFYDMIESYFPNLPRIELNARGRRAGWDAWGNEADG